MRTTYFHLAVLLIVGLLFVSCEKDINDTNDVVCEHPYINNNHSKSADFQAILEQYVSKGFPGISMYIKDSEGIWVGSSGFADISKGTELEPCHVSKAASITKLLVGTLTMKLQEEGHLDIDDKVSDYIDAKILDKIDHPEGMTLRNLMNHTTGIFDVITSSKFYLAIINNPSKDWEQEELLKFVYGQERKHLELDSSQYSNTNTLLLSMCINEAMDQEHSNLLHEKILDPLGMNDTYYQSREDLPNITAQGYYDIHNDGSLANMSNYITGSGNGYGGIFSTVFDLSKFVNAMFIDKTLLSQASLDEMLSDFHPAVNKFSADEVDRKKYSTSVSIQKKFTHMPYYGVGHSGKDLGYTADMYYFPEAEMTMIYFINYGTDGQTYLKEVYFDFVDAVLNKMFE